MEDLTPVHRSKAEPARRLRQSRALPNVTRPLCRMNNEPIPGTPPRDQFLADVLPSYRDFLTSPSLEHRARAAANALAHFAEHVFVYYNYHKPSVLAGTKRPADFVSSLARTEQCEELDIIWDLALASKHRILNRPASRQRLIITASDASRAVPWVVGSTDAFVPNPTDPLQLKLQDRRTPLVADVLEAVVRFWERWLPHP